jgi:hypothetical protein
MITTSTVRIFRGSETSQVDGHTGKPAEAALFYYEPADYEGDVLHSTGHVLLVDACQAALADNTIEAPTPLSYEEYAALTGWELTAADELGCKPRPWEEICDEALQSPECEDPAERVAAHARAMRHVYGRGTY